MRIDDFQKRQLREEILHTYYPRRLVFAGSVCHPWQFVEEVANHEVEKDFGSVYSRLVLCRTFRLDEDGKVLTPEEVRYNSKKEKGRFVSSVTWT